MKRNMRAVSFSHRSSGFLSMCLCVLAMAWASMAYAESVTVSRSGDIEIWDIRQPVINQPVTVYNQIVIRQGDIVTITAGGCAQPGGNMGLTWKRYLDPRMAASLDYLDTWKVRPFDNKHFGMVCILGITDKLAGSNMGWTSLKDIQGRSLQATLPTAGLQLGYKDDIFNDNGYTGRNDGPAMQCKGVEDAWVKVEIRHTNQAGNAQGMVGSGSTGSTGNTGGNTGTASSQATPPRDTTMPQLLSLYTNPGGFNYQGGNIGVYATAADNVAVQGVTLTLFKPDGTKSAIRMQKASGTSQNSQWATSWIVPVNTGSQQLTYAIKVDVVDSSGNILYYGQKPVTFTVDAKPASGPIGQPSGAAKPGSTLQQNTQAPVNSIQNKIPSPGVPITQPNALQNANPAVK